MKKSLIASILITMLLLTSCTKPSTETPGFDPSETTPPDKAEPSTEMPSFDPGKTAQPDKTELPLLIVNAADDEDDGICDSIHCSLREAINTANDRPGPDTITFEPSVFPPSETVAIKITSQLPMVLDGNTTIDASGTQVAIDGSKLSGTIHGLEIMSSNNTLKGIRIQNVPGVRYSCDCP